jgi:hypothetical protein
VNIHSYIFGAIHKVLLFVGSDAFTHNLLRKGLLFI